MASDTGNASWLAELVSRKRTRRNAVLDAQIDFAPMADMVFQLLAFFIMTVRLANQETMDIPRIAQGEGIDVRSAVVVEIKAPGPTNPDSVITLNDVVCPPAPFTQIRDELVSQVASKDDVIIKAEGLVPSGIVLQVGRAVAALRAENPNLRLHIGVQDLAQ